MVDSTSLQEALGLLRNVDSALESALASAQAWILGAPSPLSDESQGIECKRDHLAGPRTGPAFEVDAIRERVRVGKRRRDEAFTRQVFDKHADKTAQHPDGGLGVGNLQAALAELGVSGDAQRLFGDMDANSDGVVDYDELRAAVDMASPVEAWAKRVPWWQAVADAVSVPDAGGEDLLRTVAGLSKEQMDTVCRVVAEETAAELRQQVKELAGSFMQMDLAEQERGQCGAKFQTIKANAGTIEHFHDGLRGRVGVPSHKFFDGMKAEHCSKGGSDYCFTTPNYGFVTTANQEWRIIVERVACPTQNTSHGRVIRNLDECCRLGQQQGNLKREEVIAIVLYTGPMYFIYGTILRRFPADVFAQFENGGNLFPTTIHVLASAVMKLARHVRIPEGRLLYRGLGGTLELPDSFFKADALGGSGFCEWSFMSTTEDKKVALQYSGVGEKRPAPTVMVMCTSAVDRGACIREYSQHPQEVEYLFPPGSFLQRTGEDYVQCTAEGPVRIIGARINANNTMRTLEQLLDQKKEMHLSAFQFCLDEMAVSHASKESEFNLKREKDPFEIAERYLAFTSFTTSIVDEVRAILDRHKQVDAESYLEDETFRAMVVEMLAAKRMAASKMELYLACDSLLLNQVQDMRIREAHRFYLSFLRKQVSDQNIDTTKRTSLATTLCKAEGLIKASVDEENEIGEQVITQGAADGWDYDKLWLLIQAGGDVNGDSQVTPISAAAKSGRTSTVRALGALGADVNQTDGDGKTALLGAALGGHADALKLLAELKADVNHADRDSKTALMYAAFGGYADAVKLLAELKADVNQTTDVGITALMFAALLRQADSVKLLAELKADVNHADDDRKTALIYAAFGGKADSVRLLAELKADVNHADGCEITALMYASMKGHADAVKLLAELKADMNQTCSNGTALILAAQDGHADAVKLLAELKADVNHAYEYGTALFAASRYGHLEVVRILLQLNGDVNVTNEDGQTALSVASDARHLDIAALLGSANDLPLMASKGQEL